jgi:hypothetical protein
VEVLIEIYVTGNIAIDLSVLQSSTTCPTRLSQALYHRPPTCPPNILGSMVYIPSQSAWGPPLKDYLAIPEILTYPEYSFDQVQYSIDSFLGATTTDEPAGGQINSATYRTLEAILSLRHHPGHLGLLDKPDLLHLWFFWLGRCQEDDKVMHL